MCYPCVRCNMCGNMVQFDFDEFVENPKFNVSRDASNRLQSESNQQDAEQDNAQEPTYSETM